MVTYPKRSWCAIFRKLEPDETVDKKATVRRCNKTSVHSGEPLAENYTVSVQGTGTQSTYGINFACCGDDTRIQEDSEEFDYGVEIEEHDDFFSAYEIMKSVRESRSRAALKNIRCTNEPSGTLAAS